MSRLTLYIKVAPFDSIMLFDIIVVGRLLLRIQRSPYSNLAQDDQLRLSWPNLARDYRGVSGYLWECRMTG